MHPLVHARVCLAFVNVVCVCVACVCVCVRARVLKILIIFCISFQGSKAVQRNERVKWAGSKKLNKNYIERSAAIAYTRKKKKDEASHSSLRAHTLVASSLRLIH